MAKKTTKRTNRKRRSDNTAEWPKYEQELRFDLDEFHQKLRIDKHALDDEVEQQPEVFGEVAEAAVMAKSQVESLEEQVKLLEASIDTVAREQANIADKRITENEIKSMIVNSESRKEMIIKLLNARHQQRQLEALTTSFRHRSYALRDMVDLFLASYYSSRSASGMREGKKEAEVDRITDKMSERRKKRVKRHRQRPS